MFKPMFSLRVIIPLFLLGFTVTFSACEPKEQVMSQEEIAKTIIALERQALDEWSKGNPSAFPLNFADDATYFDDIAAQERVDGLENLKKYFESLDGQVPAHTYELIEPKVQVYGKTAIMTLRYVGTIGNDIAPPWKATSVYHNMEGQWKLVHDNWSLVI